MCLLKETLLFFPDSVTALLLGPALSSLGTTTGFILSLVLVFGTSPITLISTLNCNGLLGILFITGQKTSCRPGPCLCSPGGVCHTNISM